MKKLSLQCFAVLLAISLLVGMVPMLAIAADTDLVLTKIGHASTDTITLSTPATRLVTLTVPFGYSAGTIDFADNLIIDKAPSIGQVITSFESGGASIATVGEPGLPGPAVTMQVTYYKGEDTTTPYTTEYSLRVERAPKKAPTFTGTISKSITGVMPTAAINDITFTAKDFSDLYTANDGAAITSISLSGNNLISGSLKIKNGDTYDLYTKGTLISLSDIGKLVFDAVAGGSVSYDVSAYAGSDTSTAISGVRLNITVKDITIPTISAAVTKTVKLDATLAFVLSDFSSCYNLNNGTLKNIVITPTNSTYGTWYKGSSVFTGATTFDSSTISTLKFKGSTIGQASFTWTVSNEKGPSTSGGGSIPVTTNTSTVTYTTALNTAKAFIASDFNTASTTATGFGLNYIYFTSALSATYGKLYYGYTSASSPGSAISINTPYYYNNTTKISSVTFVPASNYTGTVSIPYTGVNTDGKTYTGTINITVGTPGNVSYSTTKNTAKAFVVADFNTACKNTTGVSLASVTFSLPLSTSGTLYYNYASATSPGTAVAASTSYAAQYISKVTFVPASNFIGIVLIPYNGVDTKGVSYTGTVSITVTGAISDISYTTDENKAVTFSSANFNSVCSSATGVNLNYIKFTLPPTASGKLYYNYTSSVNIGTAVAASTAYYVSSTPNISTVAFIPTTSFSGDVTISYTGLNTNGTTYTGKIIIKVNNKIGSSHFTDIGQTYDWAAGAVDYLYEQEVVNGAGGTLYNPAANITRGDFMVMLYRALDYAGSTASNFSDVPKGSYYYDAIAAAKSLGIALGDNNKFNPTAPLTRQDAMVLIHRALVLTGTTLTTGSSSDISGFSDRGQISAYALTAVQTLVKAGVIKGSNSKITPFGNMTRAEMAVSLHRVMVTY